MPSPGIFDNIRVTPYDIVLYSSMIYSVVSHLNIARGQKLPPLPSSMLEDRGNPCFDRRTGASLKAGEGTTVLFLSSN